MIDLTARLYNLSPKEAALKLAWDFGITVTPKATSPQRPETKYAKSIVKTVEQSPEQEILKATLPCFHSLASYYHMLQYWQEYLAPKPADCQWDPRFIEALQKKSYIAYLLDILLWGTAEEKAALLLDHGKEVAELDKRIAEQKKTFPG